MNALFLLLVLLLFLSSGSTKKRVKKTRNIEAMVPKRFRTTVEKVKESKYLEKETPYDMTQNDSTEYCIKKGAVYNPDYD